MIEGLERGATAYLCKPFKPYDFVLRVRELFPNQIKVRAKDTPGATAVGEKSGLKPFPS